jgi:cyclopropane-fatty-acyl-phospholipid synthase
MRQKASTDIDTLVSEPTRAKSPNALDRWMLSMLQLGFGTAPVGFALWDGTQTSPPHGSPAGRLVVKDRRTLVGLLLDPELNFGEAYASGRLDVLGDLSHLLEETYRAWEKEGRSEHPPRRFTLRRPNTLRRARENIHHHYDIGNEFYRLWLDEQLLYTCAYFPAPDASLEQAQVAKMDHVCRKLRLRPGDHVVEAGCGWGALALHMARHYGAQVKAFNISTEQIRYGRERARAEGLADRVEFIEDDYRNIHGRFDAFVSVGMLEHVGKEKYAALRDVIARCLSTEGGRGLVHFIGRDRQRPLNAWIRRRIFPGAYPPTLREVLERIAEPGGLSVLDVENLRLHYARTLVHWLGRFEGAVEQVRAMFGEPFVRAWRLYLAGSEAAFATGWMQLFQVVLARTGENDVPWTRDHIYGARSPSG